MISCPNCGREMIIGRPCYCASIKVEPKYSSQYQILTYAFIGLGVLYILGGIATIALIQRPMYGYIIHGMVSILHSVLILMKIRWIEERTRTFCFFRMGLIVFMILQMAPFLVFLGWIGYTMGVLLVIEALSLWRMAVVVEEVLFPTVKN